MKRQKTYKTKQSEAILLYLASAHHEFITASRIVKHFESQAKPIALTTVYRHLERLIADGKVRKYVMDGEAGACYQYIESEADVGHVSLKCEMCGGVLDVACDFPDSLEQHISSEHNFYINTDKILLYGKCENCMRNAI